jgi:hypothetical protein
MQAQHVPHGRSDPIVTSQVNRSRNYRYIFLDTACQNGWFPASSGCTAYFGGTRQGPLPIPGGSRFGFLWQFREWESCRSACPFQTALPPQQGRGNPLDYQDACSTTDYIAPTVLQGGHAAGVFIKRVEQPTDN